MSNPFQTFEWPFQDIDTSELEHFCRIENLEEGGRTFQPIFQDPRVSYAVTWFEHEFRDHNGWELFGAGWENAKPIPDVRPYVFKISFYNKIKFQKLYYLSLK